MLRFHTAIAIAMSHSQQIEVLLSLLLKWVQYSLVSDITIAIAQWKQTKAIPIEIQFYNVTHWRDVAIAIAIAVWKRATSEKLV